MLTPVAVLNNIFLDIVIIGLLFPIVVQAGKDFTYLIAIVAGFGIVGLLFYYVTSEFFSTSSPSYIFSKALKRVKADERVCAYVCG